MSFARQLSARVASLSAFNLTDAETAAILRDTKNQWGRLLLFADGTRALIPTGTATVEIKAERVDVVEDYRRKEFKRLPGLDAYLSTALQDLQYSENDDACTEEREAQDSGTIYDMPPETFASLRNDYDQFVADAGEDFAEWCDIYGADSFGSNFHLNRSGHGCGYWDRNAGELGDRLSQLSDKAGNRDFYFGDNGKVYA